jgi:hypothetical protein
MMPPGGEGRCVRRVRVQVSFEGRPGSPEAPRPRAGRFRDAVASGASHGTPSRRPRRDAPRRGGGAGTRLAGLRRGARRRRETPAAPALDRLNAYACWTSCSPGRRSRTSAAPSAIPHPISSASRCVTWTPRTASGTPRRRGARLPAGHPNLDPHLPAVHSSPHRPRRTGREPPAARGLRGPPPARV